MIAATAHAYGAALMTHNEEDFVDLGEVVHVLAAASEPPHDA